jgi:hypothetical protein
MTTNPIDTQAPVAPPQSDKELNFRKQEESFKRQLEQERQARAQAEARTKELEEAHRRAQPASDDEDYSDEPYVDHKRLKRELGKVVQSTTKDTDARIQNAVQSALAQERQNMWLKQNSDFYDVMGHAQAFADKDPELAETILAMPEGFERQKLVYKNIKALGLHKKPEPAESIQSKIDANKRSPYYMPTGVGTAPYASQSDFSDSGQKNSYDKMQELKKRLRL